ncbi:DUF883 family protein [Paracoccus beibuensis]|uniref:DUF883 family protein n=1 Tax=Paracoccus beibuensis TaxID=547602 RepID=UPI00223FD1EC|nr:DUF883 domain-containing protein [Paracoccus beibuensis]
MAHNPTTDELKRNANAAANDAMRDLRNGASRIEDEARYATGKLSQDTGSDGLSGRGAALASEALEAGRDYANRAREVGQDYAERARHQAAHLYDSGQQTAQDVAHFAEDRYDELSGMVRRHPAQALGIAAGVGFLIGLMLSRR